MKNKTTYFKTPKDSDHPFNRYDSKLWNLQNDELLIMLCILSNKTEPLFDGDTIWILNRVEIEKRLKKGGMSQIKFRTAWMNLEKKHYLDMKRNVGCVEWTVKEDPAMDGTTQNKQIRVNTIPKQKVPEERIPIPYANLNQREKMLYNDNIKIDPNYNYYYQ
jgi:hypothetical protein